MNLEPSYPAVPANVSWGAVCAGAAVAAALSLGVLMLGGAAKVTSITPQASGADAVTVPTIGWIVLTLLVAFGITVIALAASQPKGPPAP